jgi:hypothetical protein
MAVPIAALQAFQSRELELSDEQTNVRSPNSRKVIEWALVEIVILLTGIRENLTMIARRA